MESVVCRLQRCTGARPLRTRRAQMRRSELLLYMRSGGPHRTSGWAHDASCRHYQCEK